jgi:hypothetical protein
LKSCNVNPSHWSPSLPCTQLTNILIMTRSWCLLPQDCWWKATLTAHEKTLVMVFSSLRLLFGEQSSKLVRKHRSWCLLPQHCSWKAKLNAHEKALVIMSSSSRLRVGNKA